MANLAEELLIKLTDIIVPEYLYSVKTGDFILTEESSQSKCKHVQLKKTGKMLVLKFDQVFGTGHDVLPFFKSIEDVKKICDYIIIYPIKDTDKLFVFICELKSNSTKKAGKQVRAGFYFAQYLISTTLRLLGYKKYDIHYRALIFSTNPLVKGTTSSKSLAYNEFPAPDLKFKHLPCNQPCDIDAYCF